MRKVDHEAYECAVRLVHEYLVGLKELELGYNYGDGKFNALSLAQSLGEDHEVLLIYVEHIIANDLDILIGRAPKDCNAYETLIFCGQYLKRNAINLPSNLSEFLSEAALYRDRKPNKLGHHEKNSFHKIDRKLWCLCIALAQGLQSTRDDNDEDKKSACDAVCQAASQVYPRGYAYDTLKKIVGKINSAALPIPYHLKGAATLTGGRSQAIDWEGKN